jgi:AcrR family transcriptional regulator
MSKGKKTRETILTLALDLSTKIGLEGLTVGSLAKLVGMSKSGLYAHFDSKEALQSQVLDAAATHFIDAVVAPALKQPRGLPRLQSLFDLWLDWGTEGLSGGCPFIGAAAEFDDRDGPVRQTLVGHQRDVLETVSRAARICVTEGHFRTDLDVEQFAFEFWAIVLAYHHFARLLRRDDARPRATRAFTTLLEEAKA